jgi:phosphopantetheinyl transferase (holo-ACP synthase)
LTLSFDLPPLLGAGIDAEQVARFQRVAATPAGWDVAFAADEIAYALSQPEPARALCAAFCCKEALFKCLRQPFNYPECVLHYQPGQRDYELELNGQLAQKLGPAQAHAAVWPEDEGREMVAVVLLARRRCNAAARRACARWQSDPRHPSLQ